MLLGPHRNSNTSGSTFLQTARASLLRKGTPDPNCNTDHRDVQTPMRSKERAVFPRIAVCTSYCVVVGDDGPHAVSVISVLPYWTGRLSTRR